MNLKFSIRAVTATAGCYRLPMCGGDACAAVSAKTQLTIYSAAAGSFLSRRTAQYGNLAGGFLTFYVIPCFIDSPKNRLPWDDLGIRVVG